MEISPVLSTDASKTGQIKLFRASTGLKVLTHPFTDKGLEKVLNQSRKW